MHKRIVGLALCIAACAMCAAAQTVTGSGTTNTVPVFTGSSTVGNSPISVSGSNVGIGTTGPAFPFEVYTAVSSNSSAGIVSTGNEASIDYSADGGTLWHVGAQSGGNFILWNNYLNAYAMNLAQNGNVYVNGSISTSGPGTGLYFRTPPSGQYNTTLSSSLLYEGLVSGNGTAATPNGLNLMTVPWTWGGDPMTFHAGGYTWRLNSNGSGPETTAMTMLSNGNVGIGTTSPVGMLSVGTSSQFQVSSVGAVAAPSITFTGANGGTQTAPWTGVLCGGDYAEAVNAKGSRKTYEPGDVLVIGDGDQGEVEKSAEPYSTMVAGIFATKPGVIGRRQSLLKESEEIPMAMVGIVPTKVTTENGPIHRGDLLVSSSTVGYAMKGTDRTRLVGAVIGKAMGPLESGTGVIEVLVTLQ